MMTKQLSTFRGGSLPGLGPNTGTTPDYTDVKELSEVMERNRAAAKAAIRAYRDARRAMKTTRAAYRSSVRAYRQGFWACMSSFITTQTKGGLS